MHSCAADLGLTLPPFLGSYTGPPCSLFVKGLAKGATERHLQTIFNQFGSVLDCQIARHRSGRSAGFAIVTFSRHEEAMAAMQRVDNSLFLGRRLSVRWYQPEREEAMASQKALLGLDLTATNSAALASLAMFQQPADFLRLASTQTSDFTTSLTAAAAAAADPAINLQAWIAQQQPQVGGEEVAAANARWSALVNMWLNGCGKQESTTTEVSIPKRRSFDGTPSGSCSRRRTTQSSLSLSLDGLDLSGLRVPEHSTSAPSGAAGLAKAVNEDPGSFGNSRLLTKWGVSLKSMPSDELLSSSDTCSLGTSASEECHITADIKLVGPKAAQNATSPSSPSIKGQSTEDSLQQVIDLEAVLDQARSSMQANKATNQQSSIPTISHTCPTNATAANHSAPHTANKQAPSHAKPVQPRPAGAPNHLPVASVSPGLAMQSMLAVPGLDMPPTTAALAQQVQLQALQQQVQLTAAQQQYASALAQLNAARTQVMALSAALQHQGPFPAASMQAAAAASLSGFFPNPAAGPAMYTRPDMNALMMMQNAVMQQAMRGVL